MFQQSYNTSVQTNCITETGKSVSWTANGYLIILYTDVPPQAGMGIEVSIQSCTVHMYMWTSLPWAQTGRGKPTYLHYLSFVCHLAESSPKSEGTLGGSSRSNNIARGKENTFERFLYYMVPGNRAVWELKARRRRMGQSILVHRIPADPSSIRCDMPREDTHYDIRL